MKFTKNQIVTSVFDSSLKKILEYENIEGIKIYYMTDGTSLAEHQILEIEYSENEIHQFITKPNKIVEKILNENNLKKVCERIKNNLKGNLS